MFAPFAEETFFRIFFFNLGLRYGGFWGGAVLSGVLFGIAHGDLYAALPLALGGMVLCARLLSDAQRVCLDDLARAIQCVVDRRAAARAEDYHR